MSIKELEQKVLFLSGHVLEAIKSQLFAEFSSLANFKAYSVSEKRILPLFFIDLSYAVFKNERWFQNRLFEEILQEYLVSKYSLARVDCAQIIASFLEKIDDHIKMPDDGSFYRADANFIEFCVLQVLCTNDLDTAICELGLGADIYAKIAACSQDISESMKSDTRFFFNSDIELEVESFIKKISLEKIRKPWIFSIYQLKFQLAKLLCFAPFNELKIASSKCFELLLAIGVANGMRKLQIFEFIQKNEVLESVPVGEIDEKMELFLKALLRLDLIFIIESEAKVSKYQLTPLSLHLTCEAFACLFVNTFSELTRFQSIPSSWQASLISKTKDKEFIWQLLDSKVVFHPKVLDAISLKVNELGDLDRIRTYAIQGAKKAVTPNLRVSFVEFLQKNFSMEENVSIFLDLLEQDPSALVRQKVADHLSRACN